MTSIDDLFKKPNLPTTGKRKLEPLTDAAQIYKSAKVSANGDVKSRRGHASVEDAPDDEEEGPQLPAEEGDDNYGSDDDEEGRFFGGGVDAGTKDALDYIDEQDKEPYVEEKYDLSWLRKAALNFEKRISKNAELRAKFEDDPLKFMGSEADLEDDIKALSILSEHPALYVEFAKLGTANALVSLLSHENTDIAIDAIQVLSELTDEDVNAEQDQWDTLVDAFLEADILSLLTQNFQRFDESIEADRSGVYRSLDIIENLASKSAISEIIGRDKDLLSWLVSRIQREESPLTQNKQYAAEIISILLQSSRLNRLAFISLDIVDVILQILATYRKYDPPKETDEEEYAENLFDALTCLVEEPEGKAKFLEAEGVELCLIMLREGKFSKIRALRVLDHAVADNIPIATSESSSSRQGNSSEREVGKSSPGDICARLVEAAGLKTLFKLFIKSSDHATTEHFLGIFAAMLRHLPSDSAPRIRTLAKFVEKDYEKTVHLVKLRRQFAGKLTSVDDQIKKESRGMGREEQQEMEDEWLSRRLEAGLYSLQTVDTILAWLVAEDDGAKRKIRAVLAERDEGLDAIKRTLQDQMNGMEVSGDGEDDQGAKDVLETLIGFL
jgi:beta-catenin-like protein 1